MPGLRPQAGEGRRRNRRQRLPGPGVLLKARPGLGSWGHRANLLYLCPSCEAAPWSGECAGLAMWGTQPRVFSQHLLVTCGLQGPACGWSQTGQAEAPGGRAGQWDLFQGSL